LLIFCVQCLMRKYRYHVMVTMSPVFFLVNLRMFPPFCWMKSYSRVPNLPPFLTGSVYQIVSRKDLQFLMPTILGKPSFSVGSNRLYGFVENGIKPQVLAIKFHWLVINHETCS
jgi:hypothetical protein